MVGIVFKLCPVFSLLHLDVIRHELARYPSDRLMEVAIAPEAVSPELVLYFGTRN